MIFSPIEQFSIFPIIQISNLTVYFFLAILSFIFLNHQYLLQKHIEWWYPNFKNVESNVFIFLTIWFIILLCNIIGMIPYSNTITAQAVIVLSMSVPTFIAINILGISIHRWNIFYLILPAGAPLGLTPFIAVLELISYMIRTLSLTLRLSANMVAGHILMKILLYSLISLPFISPIILPIVILEFIVAGLQAYVFLTLVLSYYQDVLLPH
jgi:ATP synthase subunit 6